MVLRLVLFLWVSGCLQAYNVEHLTKVQKAVKTGQALNASGSDFRGAGSLLKGLDFRKIKLVGATFAAVSASPAPASSLEQNPGQKSDLSGANFTGLDLTSVCFAGAVLHKANFAGADISYVDFTDADLTGAVGLDTAKNVSLARFSGAIMPDGTKPTGSTWTSPSGKIFYLHNAPAK